MKISSNLYFAIMFVILIFKNCKAINLRPLPWLTEKSIIFLENFLSNKPNIKILEFGSGASTVWLAQRTNKLVSVDHNLTWHNKVKNELGKLNLLNNVNLILHKIPYYEICNNFSDEYFDLILIDGRNRKACIMNSIRILKKRGILMLDNAERPYYQCVIKQLLQDWIFNKTIQQQPDKCGFWYKNWQTNYWIKP